MPELFRSINIAPHKVRQAVAKIEQTIKVDAYQQRLTQVIERCPDCRAIQKYGVDSVQLCAYAGKSAMEIRGWLMGHANEHVRKDKVRLPTSMVLTKQLSRTELIGKQKLIDVANGKYKSSDDTPVNPADSQMRARTGDNLRWYSEMSREKLQAKFTLEDFQKLAGEMLMVMGSGVEAELSK